MDTNTNNAKLIYKYTKDNVKAISLSVDRVTQKLELILAFDIILVFFIINSYQKLPLWGVTMSGALTLLSVLQACSGLYPQESGVIVLPSELLEKCLYLSDIDYRRVILDLWEQTLEDLDTLRSKRSKFLKFSFVFLQLSLFVCFFSLIF